MKGWHLWDVHTRDKDGEKQDEYLIVATEKRDVVEAATKAEQAAKEKKLFVHEIEHSGTVDA